MSLCSCKSEPNLLLVQHAFHLLLLMVTKSLYGPVDACTARWMPVRPGGCLYGPVDACTARWMSVRPGGCLYGTVDVCTAL